MKEPKVDGAPELLARDDEEGRDEAPSDEAATSSLLELLAAPLEAPARGPSPAPERIEGVIVARLVGLDGGEALVDFGGNWAGGPLAARSLVALGEGHVGRDVALVFERGDPARPLVSGVVQRLAEPEGSVVIAADRDVVIRCGKASITLTAAGKIVIRGEYVVSRATGLNRIQGGGVEIN